MKRVLIALFLLASVPAFAQEAQHEFGVFVEFYNDELHRTGFKPDHTSTRDSRVLFLQQVLQRYCHPHWTMKRADPGRPISDEAIVWVKPGAEYRKFGDFIISGGAAHWSLGSHLDGFLPFGQLLVSPLSSLSQAAGTPGSVSEPLPPGASFAVPGCRPPAPDPIPVPQPPAHLVPAYEALGGDAFFRAQIGVPLLQDMIDGGQGGLNDGSSVWFSRATYDVLAAYMRGGTVDSSAIIKAHRNVWRGILGLPALP
jgi:hypothetical protein